MNDIIRKIRERSKSQPKTIVLPEPEDARIRDAAGIIEKEGIARILLLGSNDIDAKLKEKYAQDYFSLREHKAIALDEARQMMSLPLYYAAMMVRDGSADGFVAGAHNTTPDVARAAIRCLGVEPRLKLACSCFIMVLPEASWGEAGAFIFADCGIIPQPNSRQLAYISVCTADLARSVLGFEPRVALLSYSTKGSAKGKMVEKVIKAVELIHKIDPNLLADGELQVDAAIIPEIAKAKQADVSLGGRANVLIFPDLDAGNISYKLVQRFGHARAIGPIILGLNKPCSDLSRGCSTEDIIDSVAVTAIRAQYPK